MALKSKPLLLGLTGFASPWILTLFLLLPCTFAVFNLANLRDLASGGWTHWNAPRTPGERIWFKEGTLRSIGMQVHLWSVVPAGILLPLQFLPIMRRKFMFAHRIAGRALFVALLVGNISALIMANRSFGGTLDTQCFTIILATSTTVSVYKAWRSIREGRIDRHREWVLRAWAYAGSILSLRITMVVLVLGISRFCPDRFKFVLSCEELAYLYRENPGGLLPLAVRYPACINLAKGVGSRDVFVAVPAVWARTVENRTALVNLIFGASGVVGYFINVVLLEIYLHKTKDEDERLKMASTVKRQAIGLEKKRQ